MEKDEEDGDFDISKVELILKKYTMPSHNYEFGMPVLSMEDAIADKVIQKIKINSYRRKLRLREVGYEVCKTVPHSNIRVNIRLKEILAKYKKEEELCKAKRNERALIIDRIKNEYEQIKSEILDKSRRVKELEEDKKNVLTSLKQSVEEIKLLHLNYDKLTAVIDMSEKIRDMASTFYNHYKPYYTYMAEVSEEYSTNMSFDDFKTFLSTQYNYDRGSKAYVENVDELLRVKDSINKLRDGPQKECDEILKNCQKLYHELQMEEDSYEMHKKKYYETKLLLKETNIEKQTILCGVEALLLEVSKTLPEKIFNGIDQTTFEGKMKALRLAHEIVEYITKQLQKKEQNKVKSNPIKSIC